MEVIFSLSTLITCYCKVSFFVYPLGVNVRVKPHMISVFGVLVWCCWYERFLFLSCEWCKEGGILYYVTIDSSSELFKRMGCGSWQLLLSISSLLIFRSTVAENNRVVFCYLFWENNACVFFIPIVFIIVNCIWSHYKKH